MTGLLIKQIHYDKINRNMRIFSSTARLGPEAHPENQGIS